MALDAYLFIEGVKGEATAEGLKDFMEILSYSFGASNPSTVGTGAGGSGAGKASLSSFNVMKFSETGSAELFQRCCLGQHFPKAKVVLRKATGDGGQASYLEYEFEEVFIDSIQWSGSSGGDDRPTESLSFSFGKVTITYYKQDDKGKTTKDKQAFWNVRTAAKN
jgi:type VI secretion system secreted protein Hcp